MSILQFIKRSSGSSTTDPNAKPLPLNGILKYVSKKYLPKTDDRDVMFFTTDTRELFHGNGIGLPLTKITDVLAYDQYLDFPAVGTVDKFYIDREGKTIYFWDNGEYVRANDEGKENQYPTMEEFSKIVRAMIFNGYKQKIIISATKKTPFVLEYVPAVDTIKVYVNGIRYDEPAFIYDQMDNKVHWIFSAGNGGFDLLNDFEVLIVYDFLFSDNGITDVPHFINSHRKMN